MRKGFTLVELLVVISIMSVLTIITVSQFVTARKKARDVQRKADISAMQKALMMYYADYNRFPDNINGYTESDDWGGGELHDSTGYIYMKVLPQEHVSTLPPYCYQVSDDRKSFAIYSMMENTADTDCRFDNNDDPLFQNKCGAHDYCLVYTSTNVNPDDLPDDL